MKKILLLTSLLMLQHLAIADCKAPFTWYMDIKNQTSHSFKIDCPGWAGDLGDHGHVIAEGGSDSHNHRKNCDFTHPPRVQCTYKDKATRDTGTLTLVINLCNDVTPIGSQAIPASYACDGVTYSTHYDDFIICGGYSTHYFATGYFTITGSGNSVEVRWNGIKTNLAKGQIMANKLAKTLQTAGGYGAATATYDGQNLLIDLINNHTNPYPPGSAASQCSAINAA